MQPVSKFRLGLRFGLITGVVYALLLLLRYKFFANSPISFSVCMLLSYLAVLVLYLCAGISRKKELNGYADFKDIFQTIFIAILVTEAVYIVFNAIYLKYVDPNFFDHFKAITRDFLEKQGRSQDQIDRQLKDFDEGHQMMSPMGLIKGYGTWVIIDSIIGMIYAAILRKKKDIFQETKL